MFETSNFKAGSAKRVLKPERRIPAFILFIVYILVFVTLIYFANTELRKTEQVIADRKLEELNRILTMSDVEELKSYQPLIYKDIESRTKALKLEIEHFRFEGVPAKILELSEELKALRIGTWREEIAIKHIELKNSLIKIQRKLDVFDKLFNKLPHTDVAIKKHQNAKLALESAIHNYGMGHQDEWYRNASEVVELFPSVFSETDKLISEYFQQIPKWNSERDKLINSTKNSNKSAIVVVKWPAKLYLYRRGKMQEEYSAEFGPNWLGFKNFEGDQATPEGLYLISSKKRGSATKYHRALLINYPNAEDKQRRDSIVRLNKRKARVSMGARIEVHGHGGQGFNWTNGCVALTDKDIEALYGDVAVGTPILIIGATELPKEYVDWMNIKDKL